MDSAHGQAKDEQQRREHSRAQDRARVAEDPAKMLENFDLSAADRAVLARPGWASVRRAVALEQTRNGVWGGTGSPGFPGPGTAQNIGA